MPAEYAKSRAAPAARLSLTTAAAKQREVMPNVQRGADAGGRCAWCAGPLPAGRRRFCSDDHRRRGQKRERVIEDGNYADGVRRLVRAQGKRAGADLVMFGLFAESVDFARSQLQEAAGQLVAQGYSYADLGRALGITRQVAWKRFGRNPKGCSEPAESGDGASS